MSQWRNALGLAALAAGACGGAIVNTPRGAHPPNAAVVVPYPPPPARVEEVPVQPDANCAWVDGYWDYSDRWEWQAGEWVRPAAACRLAAVELRREAGQLLHAKPRWYPTNKTLLGPQSACPRPPACVPPPGSSPSAIRAPSSVSPQ